MTGHGEAHQFGGQGNQGIPSSPQGLPGCAASGKFLDPSELSHMFFLRSVNVADYTD